MKIKLLRKREDFINIFQESIVAFFSIKYPKTNRVDFSYIVNDSLNVVYPTNINRNELRELVSEFKYHRNLRRRVLQSVYTFLAIRWPFEQLLSSELISIPMPFDFNNNFVFIPGNHSIRVVDINNNRCFVFLKIGFDKDFINSDSEIRLLYPWLKAPKVFNKHNNWYEEERVVGLPWNRLSSYKLKEDFLVDAQKQLSKLYLKTAVKKSASNYVSKICNDIIFILDSSFSSLSEENKLNINSFVNEIGIKFSDSYGDIDVDLVCTHGDFQPGNILCSEAKYWIIDWEYSYQRSIFYDALVFDLESRSPYGLSVRFNNIMNKIPSMNSYLNWTGKVLNNEKRYYFSIFFIEDLLLRLSEVSVDRITSKNESLLLYLNELEDIKNLLKIDMENIG